MDIVSSADATKIAYDRQGEGPALVLVDGAMQARSSGSKPDLARLLAAHFTVYCYDRRGRGDSGDTQPYAVGREIEDIAALIDAAGGTAGLVWPLFGRFAGHGIGSSARRAGQQARHVRASL